MKNNKKVGKFIVASVLGTTAVSSAISSAACAIALNLKSLDDTQLGKAITDFVNKLDPKEFASTVRSFEKFSSNVSSVTGGLKYAAYGLAGLVGINLFKDVYNAVYNFSDFVSDSKKSKKIVQYSFSLPEIEKTAEKIEAWCPVDFAGKLHVMPFEEVLDDVEG